MSWDRQRRDPPRGETYVALVNADGDAGAWSGLWIGTHLDGSDGRDVGR